MERKTSISQIVPTDMLDQEFSVFSHPQEKALFDTNVFTSHNPQTTPSRPTVKRVRFDSYGVKIKSNRGPVHHSRKHRISFSE